jgi:hypothetical protein
MNTKNKSLILISLGSINLIHAILHILQFIQSFLLVSNSMLPEDSILHSPVFGMVWGVIGLVTLYIGIKDFRHHKDCHGK